MSLNSSIWHPPIKKNTRAVMVAKNQGLVFLKLFFLIIICFVMKIPTRSIFSILGYSVVSCRFSLSHSRRQGASLFLLPFLKLIDSFLLLSVLFPKNEFSLFYS